MGALKSEKLMNFSEQLDFQVKLLGVFPATETQRLGSWSLKKCMKFSEQLDFEVKLLWALPATDTQHFGSYSLKTNSWSSLRATWLWSQVALCASCKWPHYMRYLTNGHVSHVDSHEGCTSRLCKGSCSIWIYFPKLFGTIQGNCWYILIPFSKNERDLGVTFDSKSRGVFVSKSQKSISIFSSSSRIAI